jgi:NAD(P)-dependent dehydrogenase (short-subunit alcohol dehydrogenase family)
MRIELWPLGVRVALVEPGYVHTNFLKNQVAAEAADANDSPYRPFIRRYRTRRGSYESEKAGPVRVARVIHKIVRSGKPRFRYPVGLDARAGTLAARFLPERLYQALLSRATIR